MSHSMYSLLSSIPYSKNVSVIRGYSEGDKRHVDLSGERVVRDVIQNAVTSVELEM